MKVGRDHGFRTHLMLWLLVAAIPLAGVLSYFAYWIQSGRDLQAAERVTRSVAELVSKDAISISVGRNNLVYVEDELARLVETLPISYAYVTDPGGKIIGRSDATGLAVEVSCCYAGEPTWAERRAHGDGAMDFVAKSSLVLSKNKNIGTGERLSLFQFPLVEHSTAKQIGTLFVVLPKDQILRASRASALWIGVWLFAFLAIASGMAATFFSRRMAAPIEAMTRAIQQSALDPIAAQSTLERVKSLKDSTSIREIKTLRQSLVQLHETILTQQKVLEESRLAHLFVGLAAHMAHDIRKPLAVLRDFEENMSQTLPKEIFLQVRDAIDCVHGIAESLLQPIKPGAISTLLQGNPLWTSPVPTAIKGSIDRAVTGKRSAYAKRGNLKIEARWDGEADQAWVSADPQAFQRSLSNLIDNAADAIDGAGLIILHVSKQARQVRLVISDTGRGIPADILPRLGRPGETHGRVNGVGLRLFGAKSAFESWGGTFSIESKVGKGTSIQILLPEVVPPPPAELVVLPNSSGATRVIDGRPTPCLVLIDDDASIRSLWTLKARENGLTLMAVASFEEWKTQASSVSFNTPIFIDCILGAGESGVDVAARLHAKGYSDLYITTGKAKTEIYTPDYIRGVIGKQFPKELFLVKHPST
ncbi:ATP-binding protein [Bdellovibrionota bacterium FG-1]